MGVWPSLHVHISNEPVVFDYVFSKKLVLPLIPQHFLDMDTSDTGHSSYIKKMYPSDS
jgi:hypothetical protein